MNIIKFKGACKLELMLPVETIIATLLYLRIIQMFWMAQPQGIIEHCHQLSQHQLEEPGVMIEVVIVVT